MSDERHWNFTVAVVFRPERKQREHVIPDTMYRAQTPATPCPDRGADVMHGWNSVASELLFQTKIVIRCIHADEQGRGMTLEVRRQTAALRRQLGIAAERLETDQRQAFHRVKARATLRLHTGPTDAFKHDMWQAPLELAHEPGRQQVTGHLACDNADAYRCSQRCHVTG